MTLFGDAIQSAYDTIEEMAGEQVIYVFDGVEITVNAVPGKKQSQVDVPNGRAIVQNQDLDWLISKEQMVVNGVPIEPKRGNVIRRGAIEYRVAAPQGSTCWEWSGPYQTYYRIHTVQHKR